MNCIFNCNNCQTSNVSSFGCVTILLNYIFTTKGVWQWEELKHAVLGVIVLCSKFQGDLHRKES